MFKLLVILFIIKFYAQYDILRFIKKKHGQNVITVIRSLEQMQTKYVKIDADIKFIKSCKKENLILTFEKTNFSIKSGRYKLKQKIARLIMNTELQNKHIQKQKLKKKIKKICTELKRTVSLIILNICFHQINIALKSKLKKITKRHDTKLINLHRQQYKGTFGITITYVKNTVYNFPSYQLSND